MDWQGMTPEDAERYVKLNMLSRHDLVKECMSVTRTALSLERTRKLVSEALDAHLNKGMSAEDAMRLVRKAHFPSWDTNQK